MCMYDFQDDRSSGQIEVIVCLTLLQHMYMYEFQDDRSSGQIEVIGGDNLENLKGKVGLFCM